MPVETSATLSLHAMTPDLLDAEEQGGATLAARLGARPPETWPPEFNGPESRAWMRRLLAAHPGEPGYGGWYVVAEGGLAGICGFKGPPDAAGVVEIGYSVIAPCQRRGIATGAVRLLLARAFRDPRVTAVAAETLPYLTASRAVLERTGFALAGRRHADNLGEILRYLRPRPP